MEITKKQLNDYIQIKKHIEIIKERINYYSAHPALQCHSIVKGSNPEYPYLPTYYKVGGGKDGAYIKNEDETREKIKNLKYLLMQKQEEAEQLEIEIDYFIVNIKNIRLRNIFYLRYIEGFSEEETAEKVNLSRTAINKAITRYLQCH